MFTALLAALEADGAEPFQRLVQRTGFVLNAEVVDSLLAPKQGGSLWRTIVLQRDKHSVVEALVAQDQAVPHPRLRAATLAIVQAESSHADAEDGSDAEMEGEGEWDGEEGEMEEEMDGQEEEESNEEESEISDASEPMTE